MQHSQSQSQSGQQHHVVPPTSQIQRQSQSSANLSQPIANARALRSTPHRQSTSQSQQSQSNLSQNVQFQMQHPMRNLMQNDDIKLQQQHTDRIFHATDSLPGHRARLGRRLPSESSFGIVPLQTVQLNELHELPQEKLKNF